jgi:hypothetical protein
MVLVYLVNKPHVSRRITKWLQLFLEYEFTVVYKLGHTHVVVDALFRLLNSTKLTRVLDKTIHVSLFML